MGPTPLGWPIWAPARGLGVPAGGPVGRGCGAPGPALSPALSPASQTRADGSLPPVLHAAPRALSPTGPGPGAGWLATLGLRPQPCGREGAKGRLELSPCSSHFRVVVLRSYGWGRVEWFQCGGYQTIQVGARLTGCPPLVVQTLERGHGAGASPVKQQSLAASGGLRHCL